MLHIVYIYYDYTAGDDLQEERCKRQKSTASFQMFLEYLSS
jgi:hypothetical protein